MVRYLTHNIWKLAQSPPQTQTLSRGHGHSITITAARHTYVFLTVNPSFFLQPQRDISHAFCILPSFSFPEPLSLIHSIIHTQTHTQTWCGRLIEKYLILSSVSFSLFSFFFHSFCCSQQSKNTANLFSMHFSNSLRMFQVQLKICVGVEHSSFIYATCGLKKAFPSNLLSVSPWSGIFFLRQAEIKHRRYWMPWTQQRVSNGDLVPLLPSLQNSF